MLKYKRRLCVSCYRQAKYKAGNLEGSLVEGKVVKQLVIYTWQDYYEKIKMSWIRNGFQTLEFYEVHISSGSTKTDRVTTMTVLLCYCWLNSLAIEQNENADFFVL